LQARRRARFAPFGSDFANLDIHRQTSGLKFPRATDEDATGGGFKQRYSHREKSRETGAEYTVSAHKSVPKSLQFTPHFQTVFQCFIFLFFTGSLPKIHRHNGAICDILQSSFVRVLWRKSDRTTVKNPLHCSIIVLCFLQSDFSIFVYSYYLPRTKVIIQTTTLLSTVITDIITIEKQFCCAVIVLYFYSKIIQHCCSVVIFSEQGSLYNKFIMYPLLLLAGGELCHNFSLLPKGAALWTPKSRALCAALLSLNRNKT
jgi:hypothetical protein